MTKYNHAEAQLKMAELIASKPKPKKELNAVNVRAEVKKLLLKMSVNQNTVELARHLDQKYGKP